MGNKMLLPSNFDEGKQLATPKGKTKEMRDFDLNKEPPPSPNHSDQVSAAADCHVAMGGSTGEEDGTSKQLPLATVNGDIRKGKMPMVSSKDDDDVDLSLKLSWSLPMHNAIGDAAESSNRKRKRNEEVVSADPDGGPVVKNFEGVNNNIPDELSLSLSLVWHNGNEQNINPQAAQRERNGVVVAAAAPPPVPVRPYRPFPFPLMPYNGRFRNPIAVLKVESEDDDRVDDGFRWRKYGQKLITGSPHIRSYYRCSKPGCDAKKHLQRSFPDSECVIVTYQGKHNHAPRDR